MDKKYLKRASSGLWLYRRKTPVILKDKYGSNYIQYSLETHSYHEAILKRNAINSEVDLELSLIKRGDADKAKFYHYFTPWRKERVEREGEGNREEEYHPMDEADLGVVVDSKDDKANPAVQAAWTAAMTGNIPEEYRPTIRELSEEWATWADGKRDTKYVSAMATYVKALIAFTADDILPSSLTTGQAQLFLDALIEAGKSASTVTHYKSKLQELWRWALAREKTTGTNPWLNTKVEASKKKTSPEHYRNFTDDELKIILEGTELDRVTSSTWAYPYALHMLPRLLPFLGTRLSELALAKTEQFIDLDGRMFFEVREGKTINAQRIVPICPVIRPLFDAVIKKAGKSPWLFPEIGNAAIGASKAVNSISSKFGKLTKSFDKVTGYKTGLHSFRGHFATALEQIGCPEEIATKLAGHKHLSLTYNLYSKYKNKDELWQYIEKIHEADCLRSLVQRT